MIQQKTVDLIFADNRFMMLNKQTFIIIVLIFALGLFIGYSLDSNLKIRANSEYRSLETESESFSFVSPLLECESYEAGELKSFKEIISDFTTESIRKGLITDASVYFRDLNNGLWLAINENDHFTPASLLKVPLAMSYLKEAQTDANLLDRKIIVKDEHMRFLTQNYVSSKSVVVGREYTVRELLEYMLIYSDNNAQRVLYENALGKWRRVFNDLGIALPEGEKDGDFITVKDYARFFRVLYNASYLSKEDSNYLLELLSKSEFKQGLSLGVPKNVVISHKFGERKFNEVEQLHDCGVVYLKKTPYVLCVMSRGQDSQNLSRYIGKISSLVYEEVANQAHP